MSLSCTFKLVYTSMAYNYDINISQSSEYIYQNLSNRIINDFQLTDNNFDIVLAGQENRERANPIPRSSQSFGIFLNNRNNCSFYVRPCVTRNNNRNTDANQHINSCPICLIENVHVYFYYQCNHLICSICNNNWQQQLEQNNNNRCPICRSN